MDEHCYKKVMKVPRRHTLSNVTVGGQVKSSKDAENEDHYNKKLLECRLLCCSKNLNDLVLEDHQLFWKESKLEGFP